MQPESGLCAALGEIYLECFLKRKNRSNSLCLIQAHKNGLWNRALVRLSQNIWNVEGLDNSTTIFTLKNVPWKIDLDNKPKVFTLKNDQMFIPNKILNKL